MSENSTTYRDNALALARRGWYVFPLHYPILADGTVRCSCNYKAECVSIGKHPLTKTGHYAATTDERHIENMFTNEVYPTPNIGIALERSGLVIIAPDSEMWHEEFKKRGLPETYTVQSGNGYHYYYRNLPIGGPIARICKSQEYDILSDGFIVAAGSLHKSGKIYTIVKDVQNLPSVPKWAIEELYEKEKDNINGEDGTLSIEWQSDEPPVKLSKVDSDVWYGKSPAYKEDGTIDRSKTIWKIGTRLAKKTDQAAMIAAALKNRDETLFNKFSDRRWADTTYLQIANKVIASVSQETTNTLTVIQSNGNATVQPITDIATSTIGYRCTDLGNGERFAEQHGAYVRWIYEQRQWAVYDGKRWRLDETNKIGRLAKKTVRSIYGEAADTVSDRERNELGEWAKTSEGVARINAMLELAKSEEGITASILEFDIDKMIFNVLNGTIDLETCTIRPHSRADMLMKLAPVEYVPGVESERWIKFLERVQPREDMRHYLGRVAYYLLTGETKEEVFFILNGGGRNGKGTYVETLQAMMGDYAQTAPMQTFIKSSHESGEKASPDIARMRGARMVAATEINEGIKFDMARIKNHTGGDTLSARFLHKGYFDFRPTHKLLFSVNILPTITDTSYGMWRRPHVIPFIERISDEEIDMELKSFLRSPHELTGILNWCLAYGEDWLTKGLDKPEEITKAIEEYRVESDVIQSWIDAHCVYDPTITTLSAELYEDYKSWVENHKLKWEFPNVFGQQLTMKIREQQLFPAGEERYRKNKERRFKGIRLLRWDEKPAIEKTFSPFAEG